MGEARSRTLRGLITLRRRRSRDLRRRPAHQLRHGRDVLGPHRLRLFRARRRRRRLLPLLPGPQGGDRSGPRDLAEGGALARAVRGQHRVRRAVGVADLEPPAVPARLDVRRRACPMGNIVGTYGVFLFGYSNWAWIVPLWAKRTAKVRGETDAKTHAMFFTFGVITFLGFWIRVLLSGVRGVEHAAGRRQRDGARGRRGGRLARVPHAGGGQERVVGHVHAHRQAGADVLVPVDSAEMAPGNRHLNWQFAFYPRRGSPARTPSS